MLRIIQPRNSGKSTKLLQYALEHDCDIATATVAMANCLVDTARWSGMFDSYSRVRRPCEPLQVGPVRIYSAHDLIGHQEGRSFRKQILIDELDAFLQRCLPQVKIAGYSISDDFPTGWINAEHELPPEGELVLCYYEYFRFGDYDCMWRAVDTGYQFAGHWGGNAAQGQKVKVLSWRSIPEPPGLCGPATEVER